jgi:hypothetical protein
MGGAFGVVVGKPEGRRALSRPKRIWVYNIKVDVSGMSCLYREFVLTLTL